MWRVWRDVAGLGMIRRARFGAGGCGHTSFSVLKKFVRKDFPIYFMSSRKTVRSLGGGSESDLLPKFRSLIDRRVSRECLKSKSIPPHVPSCTTYIINRTQGSRCLIFSSISLVITTPAAIITNSSVRADSTAARREIDHPTKVTGTCLRHHSNVYRCASTSFTNIALEQCRRTAMSSISITKNSAQLKPRSIPREQGAMRR